jgi:hypothetical protein
MLNPHDYFDRRIRAAMRETRAADRFTIVKLDEPIQRGWKRMHVLTSEARRRGDSEILAEIVRRIGNTQHHHDGKFLRRKGRGRRKRMVEIHQPLHEIPTSRWGRANLPESWEKYFRLEGRTKWKKRHEVWVFKYPYLFELRVEPNLYWYVRIPDPDAETRRQEISAWLRWNPGHERYANLRGKSWRRKWLDPRDDQKSRIRELDQIAFRAMRGEVDPAMSVGRGGISFQRHVRIMANPFSLS